MQLLSSIHALFPAKYHGNIFLVGGSVRDFLLGRRIQDIDLAAALPDEIFLEWGFRLVKSKTSIPIWFKYDPPLGKIEVIRLEDDGALHKDLLRRDFTINAIAMRLSGELIDPMNGEDDLRKGRLCACSDDTFRHDPLRIFRGFRFEADGWRMTSKTAALIRERSWETLLGSIPVERFTAEMRKALEKKEPERFFLLMMEFRVGEAWLPELFRLPNIPAGPLEHHPEEDLFSHSIQVLQRVAAMSDDPLARFCALFHDIGKLATPPSCWPGHRGHGESGFAMAIAFCNRLALSAIHRKALAWTSRLHTPANKWQELRDATKLRVAEQAMKACIADILPLVSTADKPYGNGMNGWKEVLQILRLTLDELGIEQSRLELVECGKRKSLILQRRVEALRKVLYGSEPS